MTRLVLLMGVQRSGTNALFKSLTSDPAVLGVNEAPDSAFFQDVLLRPERELRPHLQAWAGPVVLKPISETNWRSVAAVLEEFSAYELRIPWIYRDPVNCFYSHVERWEGFRGRPEAFAAHWSARNASALEAVQAQPGSVAVIRYEDLVADPAVFAALCAWLEIPGSYLFRPDRSQGRTQVPADQQARIDADTAEVLARLEAARSFRAGDAGALTRTGARLAGRLKRQWGKLRASAAAEPGGES